MSLTFHQLPDEIARNITQMAYEWCNELDIDNPHRVYEYYCLFRGMEEWMTVGRTIALRADAPVACSISIPNLNMWCPNSVERCRHHHKRAEDHYPRFELFVHNSLKEWAPWGAETVSLMRNQWKDEWCSDRFILATAMKMYNQT